MKRLLLYIVLGLLPLVRMTGQDQGIVVRNATVAEALNEIGRKTGYEFFYNA